MAKATRQYKVDISLPIAHTPSADIHHIGDKNAHEYIIELFDDDLPCYGFTGCEAHVIEADGTRVTVEGAIVGNEAHVVLSGDVYTVAGYALMTIQVQSADEKLTVFRTNLRIAVSGGGGA